MFKVTIQLKSYTRVITFQNYTQAKTIVDLYHDMGYVVVMKEA